MADITQAVEFVLHQEDARLSGAITTLPGDRGGPTRFGLASRFHPDLVKQGYFSLNEDGSPEIPHDDALAIAEAVYAEQYGTCLQIDQIASQDIADRLLSFAINEGPHEAVTLAQRACADCGHPTTVDGLMGPNTVAALNACDPDQWRQANAARQAQFYRNLVAARPAMLPELAGLLNRANA